MNLMSETSTSVTCTYLKNVSALLCGRASDLRWIIDRQVPGPSEPTRPNETRQIFCLLVSLAKLGDARACAVNPTLADAINPPAAYTFYSNKEYRFSPLIERE